MVGVGHGPDAGVGGQLLGPVFRDPGEQAADDRQGGQRAAAGGGHGGGHAVTLDEDVGEGAGSRGGGPGVGRGWQRRDQQHKRRDKQEYTRDQGRPASAGRAHPDGLHVRRHYRAQLSRSGDRVDAGWASRKR